MNTDRGLISLAIGTFALGIAEFTMMGILSELAADLGVSITDAGHLISAYAAGVCIGAPILLFARKLRLKTVMLLLSAVIVAGNMLAAVAPGYWTLFAARVLSGLPHGGFFGVGAIVARRLARRGRETRAVSLMIAGMTVATLGGVPLGTLIAGTMSWRLAFLLIGICGIATYVAIRCWVRDVGRLEPVSFAGQFRFLRTLPPWLIFGGVLFGQIGIYCWYSYIDPLLTDVAGFDVSSLPWLMVLAGAGMMAGNMIAGVLGDRFKPSLIAALVQAAAIPVLLLIFFFASYQVAAVVLMVCGTAALFGSGSPLQSSIVGYSAGGEMLGAACIQIAYNAGNAIAAWLGGIVIASGAGYQAPAVVGIPIVAVGCILLVVLYNKFERAQNSLAK